MNLDYARMKKIGFSIEKTDMCRKQIRHKKKDIHTHKIVCKTRWHLTN